MKTSTFDKAKYLALIADLRKRLRRKNYSWMTTYSEPRVKTGYRTKLYCAGDDSSKIVRLIEKQYPELNAKVIINRGRSVYISPKDWQADFNTADKVPYKIGDIVYTKYSKETDDILGWTENMSANVGKLLKITDIRDDIIYVGNHYYTLDAITKAADEDVQQSQILQCIDTIEKELQKLKNLLN